MSYILEIKKNEAIFTLTITKEEVEKGMKEAAKLLAEESSIPGFRAGKAPYDVVKQRVGEMKILEAAAEPLIRSEFYKAMLEENLDTVGQPYFEMEKMAPGNNMVVKATVALYPKMKKLADFKNLSIEKKDTLPTKEMVKQAKKDLTRMQTKEVRRKSGEPLIKGDKAIVSLTIKKDGVVLEGGEAQNHAIMTGEEYYITGMAEKLQGAKEGEEKKFTLSFPKDHYQKQLAGQDVDFEVIVNEIYELQAPEINNEFAKSLGMKDTEELDMKINENLQLENEAEEKVRQEQACLDLLIDKSDFEDIPDILVNQEINKMIGELEHTLSHRGMKMDEYLSSINKSMADLKIDFTPTAIKRIKAAIIIKEIAKNEDIKVDEKQLDEELDRVAQQYPEEQKKAVYEPRFREYVRMQLLNKKTVERIKEEMVK